MNLFSNTTNEQATRKASNATSKFGSGSEVDRYESHFGIGSDGIERMKKAATDFKGVGAEQDRYQSHFGLDADKVQEAAKSILNAKGDGAEQDRHGSHFGLGADGWERAKQLARMQGEGAEQVGSVHDWLPIDRANVVLGSLRISLRSRQRRCREGSQVNTRRRPGSCREEIKPNGEAYQVHAQWPETSETFNY